MTDSKVLSLFYKKLQSSDAKIFEIRHVKLLTDPQTAHKNTLDVDENSICKQTGELKYV